MRQIPFLYRQREEFRDISYVRFFYVKRFSVKSVTFSKRPEVLSCVADRTICGQIFLCEMAGEGMKLEPRYVIAMIDHSLW